MHNISLRISNIGDSARRNAEIGESYDDFGVGRGRGRAQAIYIRDQRGRGI